ncbi:MAG: hypothetical protein WCA38_02795 [Candidatus Acidiferrales bacterium]
MTHSLRNIYTLLTNAKKRDPALWSARKEGLDMAFKIRGMYVREAENKGPEFTVVVINGHRPDWEAMHKAHPQIEVPGLSGPIRESRPGDASSETAIPSPRERVKLISGNNRW